MDALLDRRRTQRLACWAAALTAGAIVAGFLLANSCHAGDRIPDAAEAAALFERDAVFLSGAEPANRRELLAAFRAHRRSQPTPKLHLIAPTSGLNPPEALIKEGFILWNYPAVPVQPPVNWAMDPFGDVSWRYQFNTLIFVDPVLSACEKFPDPEFLRFAVDVARDWLRQNWDKAENPNEFAWYDMAVGVRAPKFAWLAHAAACSDAFDDEALMDLLRGALRHGQELRDPANLAKDTNHGIYQMLGLLGLIRTLPEMRGFGEYERYATETVERLFVGHYCEEEGAHLEHSPAYHLYLTHLLAKSMSTGLVSGDRLESLQDRAFNVLAWMIKPDGSIARFGDGADRRQPISRHVLAAPLRDHYPSYWFALTGGEQGTAPPEEALILPQSGYAFIRGPWPTGPKQWSAGSYLAFLAAFHSRTHKHADDGTFEWSELGRPLLIDSGGFAYHYHLPERQYCESTRAHNTLEIDGEDLSRDPADAYGSAIKRWAKTGGTHAIEAEFTRKPDIRHRRTLICTPGQWLVVLDDVRAGRPHRYTQWFHFDPELDVSVVRHRLLVKLPRSEKHLIAEPLAQPEGLSLRTVRGQKEPRLEGWTSIAYKELTPNWAAAYSALAQDAILATLFVLADESVEIRDQLVRAPDPQHLELAWSLDGEFLRLNLQRSRSGLTLDVIGPGRAASESAH